MASINFGFLIAAFTGLLESPSTGIKVSDRCFTYASERWIKMDRAHGKTRGVGTLTPMIRSKHLQTPKSKTRLGNRQRQRLRQLFWIALFLSVSFGSVPAAAQSYAYVPTHKSNSVSVINTSTRSVIALVPVGIQPLQAAISPDGAFAFVTDSGWFYPNNDVSVISTATNSVVATIPVGRFPVGVAFTPNGALAYVVNQNSNNVSVIDTTARTVVATVNVGVNPWGVAVTPNGSFAYVTQYKRAPLLE
jgi:YVTN family beta-propeller protein